jgi:hypothetical protein
VKGGFTVNLDGLDFGMSLVVRYRKAITSDELLSELAKLCVTAMVEVETRLGEAKVQ